MIEVKVREKAPCPTCKGRGWFRTGVVSDDCRDCNGQGYRVQDRWINLEELQRLLAQVGVDDMFPPYKKKG